VVCFDAVECLGQVAFRIQHGHQDKACLARMGVLQLKFGADMSQSAASFHVSSCRSASA